MSDLIDKSVVTYEVACGEEELRSRLAEEVMRHFGLLNEGGKPVAGVFAKVLRGEGRTGGYRIRITRDMSKDNAPRLPAPEVRRD